MINIVHHEIPLLMPMTRFTNITLIKLTIWSYPQNFLVNCREHCHACMRCMQLPGCISLINNYTSCTKFKFNGDGVTNDWLTKPDIHAHTHKPVHMQNGTTACPCIDDDYRSWEGAFCMLHQQGDVNAVPEEVRKDEAGADESPTDRDRMRTRLKSLKLQWIYKLNAQLTLTYNNS